MYFRGAGTDVIGDGKCAAKTLWRHRAFERGEQRFRITVGNWQRGDFGERGNVFEGETLYIALGADAGRRGIAGVDGHVHDAAALHAVLIAHGALGKDIVLEVAVVAGIGVNDAANGAVFRGDLGLDAAPRHSVARDHDRALHRDAKAVELFVVTRQAVVDVNQFAGDIAVTRVSVVGGKLLALLVRRGIDRNRRLLEFGGVTRGLGQFEHALFGRGKEDVKGLNLRVEPPGFELGEDPLGVLLVIGRADVVRARA